MIFETIDDFAAALPRARALVGLDLGTKTIGVSVSDGLLSVASPLETIKRTKYTADAARLEQIIEARYIGGIVLGLPF
ncbi:MAG TPA: Holliday junction resolvase RuvX, partial [Rhodobacteraceae bacterium]|nr:Holliday junction resolvase RuvX [Paracoccaceae bacterium]